MRAERSLLEFAELILRSRFMTRAQKKMIFWISVLSLNFIPLIAYGTSDQTLPTFTAPQPKKKAPAAQGAPKKNAKKPLPALPNPAPAPAPSASPAPAPVAEKHYDGAAADLTMKDLTGNDAVIMDFDARIEGPHPHDKAKVLGRIFSDCAKHLQITQEKNLPGCGNDVAFRFRYTADLRPAWHPIRDRIASKIRPMRKARRSPRAACTSRT